MWKGEPDKRSICRYKKGTEKPWLCLSRWQRTQTIGKECCRYVSIMIISFPARIIIQSGATVIQ